MTYQFEPPIYDADPEKVGAELSALQNEDGVIAPEAIVEKARSPKSAMHDMFEWSDSDAAEKYRLLQAKQILRIFVVEHKIKQEDGTIEVKKHRVYERAPQGYRPVLAMAERPDEWEFLIDAVKAELLAARAKLITIQSLGQAVGSKARLHVDRAVAVLEKKKGK